MTGYIYLFRNNINGKCYVGQTINVKRRYYEHVNCNTTSAIHRALNKYGEENFEFLILETIDDENRDELLSKMNELEKSYIQIYDSYNNGYNLTIGGDGTLGAKWPEKSRMILSESKKGMNNPAKVEEVRKKISNTLKKYHETHHFQHTEETKLKISRANSGENNGMYGKCGELNPSYGRDWTKFVSEEKMAEFRRKRHENTAGENNPMYGKSAMKGKKYTKLVWIDDNNELHIMSQKDKNRYHPDWVLYTGKIVEGKIYDENQETAQS